MTEPTLQIIASMKLLWLAVYTFLYGWGGMKGKYKRRYIGSAWLVGGICLASYIVGTFSWWFLAMYPLLVMALSKGYGADKTSKKIQKRAFVGLLLGLAALPIVLVTQMWGLFIAHIIVSIAVSVSLGVWNFSGSARDEETLIAAFTGILPLFMV